jgi:apolipoprotein N-acyltransferase
LATNSYSMLIFPSLWVLVEYFRGAIVLNGFPWLLAGYSQLESPLSGYIPVLGIYGTGFLLALSASIIVTVYFRQQQRLKLVALLAVLWIAGQCLQTFEWTHVIGKPIRVSLIQGSMSQDQKWLPENRQKTLLFYKKMTEENWDSSVIVWPETAIPAYLSDVYTDFLFPLSQSAKKHNSDLIVSLPMHGETDQVKYNAVVTLGKQTGIYRKIHLLPFGEYLPWQPLSGFILSQLHINLGLFTPGQSNQNLLVAGGFPFVTSICYEDAFGEAAISKLREAAFLINVTNDGWFGNTIEPHQHLQIARARALETGRFLLRSTNTGATAIIDPKGVIVKQAPMFQATVLTGYIKPMADLTPYSIYGDKPLICLLLFVIIWSVLCHFFKTESTKKSYL